MANSRRSFAALVLLFVPAATAQQAESDRCARLINLTGSRTAIIAAETVPSASEPVQLPAYCKVQGVVTTKGIGKERDGKVKFEVDLPAENWNGKLYFAGGGGFSGGSANRTVLARGYASAFTDAGHPSLPSGHAEWALNSQTRKVDFFDRGIHAGAVAAKAVARAFYQKPLQQSYFVGCSTGGKQALIEAQRYPGDFTGIVAGAPALDYTSLMLEFSWNQRALLQSAAGYIPNSKLSLISKAVLAECDAKDGLADGLIDDPRACRFEPAALQCQAGEQAGCLTKQQVGTLTKLYAGPATAGGRSIFPGMPMGYEDSRDYVAWVFGANPPAEMPDKTLSYENGAAPNQFTYQQNFLRYLAFRKDDADYDWRSFDFDADLPKLAYQAKLHNGIDPDLRRFARRGGKLIVYHGWADPVVLPLRTIQYFENVKSVLGTEATDRFARLLMAPGMAHCGGGPGPNSIDVLSALEKWVEQGTPPDRIVATKRVNNLPGQDIERTRPLCAYPKVARYVGSGSIDEEANFRCVNP